MSVRPHDPPSNSLGSARWGTAVIVLLVLIVAVVVGYVINGKAPPPQLEPSAQSVPTGP